jgi:porin
MRKITGILYCFILIICTPGVLNAQDSNLVSLDPFSSLCRRQTLTDGFFGLNDSLADSGLEVGLGVTNVYQQNVHGGISMHRQAGRNSGSYDLEIESDLEKLLGIKEASLYLRAEGGWTGTEGINNVSTGSAFGVNADAKGNYPLEVAELFYEGTLFDTTVKFMAGKIDLTWVFDDSTYASCECTQFMNVAFVDNPTIPFPQYSLAVVLAYKPVEYFYLKGGVADAQADAHETGLRTAFYGEDYYFFIIETGVTTKVDSTNGELQGNYRVGLWNDPRPKSNSDSLETYRDDAGFYLSFDQMLTKENSLPQDMQGLGTFARYGYADGNRNDVTNFWSLGFQYQGLLDDRDDDVIGAAYAHGCFSDNASSTYPDDYESAIEVYINTQITPWFTISPGFQYISNPGGSGETSDATIIGLRAQMLF